MLEIDAGLTDGAASTPRRRSSGRSHKRGQGAATKQAQEGLQGVTSLIIQGASEGAAVLTGIPGFSMLEGAKDENGRQLPGEAEIIAILPARWMANTAFGRQVGRYLISDEDKAVALTMIAYVMRLAPPVWAKWKETNVSRRFNSEPRRTPVPQQPPAPDQRGVVIPISAGLGPAIIGGPDTGRNGRATANGAHPGGEPGVIAVPRIGS